MSKVKCLQCGKILESKTVHDFQSCDCPNKTFIDGGDNYIRVGGVDMDKVQILSNCKINTTPAECKIVFPPEWEGVVDSEELENWLNEKIHECDIEIAMRGGFFSETFRCRQRTYHEVLEYVNEIKF